MRLGHLGLPVADLDRSLVFYATHFGFDPTTATRYPDGTVIVRNADGFDLALHPVASVGARPPFLHFGFHLTSAEEVRSMLASISSAGVEVVEQYEEPGLVSFKCLDPDGWPVEVYWEPGA
jgi:catechol 2,3-dioxygenase-like lactoylglutathione lyase family enzyme